MERGPDGGMVILLDGWMAGWLDGWMVGWLDGWMAEWLNGYIVALRAGDLHETQNLATPVCVFYLRKPG